jgi:hypothetical protein
MISQKTIEELKEVKRMLLVEAEKCCSEYGFVESGKRYEYAWSVREAAKFQTCIKFLEDMNEEGRLRADLPLKFAQN